MGGSSDLLLYISPAVLQYASESQVVDWPYTIYIKKGINTHCTFKMVKAQKGQPENVSKQKNCVVCQRARRLFDLRRLNDFLPVKITAFLVGYLVGSDAGYIDIKSETSKIYQKVRHLRHSIFKLRH